MKKLLISMIASGLFCALYGADAASTEAAAKAPAAQPAAEAQTADAAQPAAEKKPLLAFRWTDEAPDLGKLSVSGVVGYTSEYIFRGLKQSDSAIQAQVELGYELGKGNLYAGAWTSQPVGKAGQPNELDVYLGYLFPVTDTLKLDVGYTHYWFPKYVDASYASNWSDFMRGGDYSNELYLGINWDTADVLGGLNLNPALYYYYDWDCDKHTVEASVSYDYDLQELTGIEGLGVGAKLYLGYQTTCRPYGKYNGWDTYFSRVDGLYYGAGLTVTYKLNDFVGFYAGLNWAGSQPTDGNGNAWVGDRNWNFLYGTAGVTFGL